MLLDSVKQVQRLRRCQNPIASPCSEKEMPYAGAGSAVGSRLGFDGQEKDKIGARKPKVRAVQGKAALDRIQTCP